MSYPSSYHQSTDITANELAARIKAATKQDEAVMAVMDAGLARTPSQMHRLFLAMGKRWPITSVRRSMTNLTKGGQLVKTGETRRGPYGHVEHLRVKA